MKRHAESHLDHSLTPAQVDYVLARFADREAFFIETIQLPEELGTVPCGLHGPATGGADVPADECHYAARGNRAYPSRLCKRQPVQVREVTVIGGPHEGECILYTAFGGPAAPKEPLDPRLKPEEMVESVLFWRVNALGE